VQARVFTAYCVLHQARVAVAAGACACVVANHDKETFGMSYTDDGLPFDALNIPV
jgi:hypothetical protein